MSTKEKWLHGLMAAFIGGVATAIDSGLALMIIAPKDFNLDSGLGKTGLAVLVLGILSGVKVAMAYLKQSPLPAPDEAPAGTPKLPLILLPFLLAGLIGSAGCRSLAPEGVYHGDPVLHQTELSTVAAYDAVHTFVTWEKENRPALGAWPGVKTAADKMRREAPQWFKTAYALRDAYAAAPTAKNRVALEQALAVLHAALTEVAFYMGQVTAQPLPPPAN